MPGGAAAAASQLLDAVAGPDGLAAAVADIRLTSLRLEAAADLYVAREEALARLVAARREITGQYLALAAVVTVPVVVVGAEVIAVGAALGEAHIFVAGSAVALVTSRDADTVRDESAPTSRARSRTCSSTRSSTRSRIWSGIWPRTSSCRTRGWSMSSRGRCPYAVGALLAVPPGLDSAYRPRPTDPLGSHPRGVGGHGLAVSARGAGARYRSAGRGIPTGPPEPVAPGVAGLLTGVQRRSEESKRGRPGLIGIREIPAASGRPRAWVVELPGTQNWNPSAGRNPMDLPSNLQTFAGGTSGYQQGVIDAMRGRVRPGEPVMLVGHSQGGLTAAALARDPMVRKQFNITTCGDVELLANHRVPGQRGRGEPALAVPDDHDRLSGANPAPHGIYDALLVARRSARERLKVAGQVHRVSTGAWVPILGARQLHDPGARPPLRGGDLADADHSRPPRFDSSLRRCTPVSKPATPGATGPGGPVANPAAGTAIARPRPTGRNGVTMPTNSLTVRGRVDRSVAAV